MGNILPILQTVGIYSCKNLKFFNCTYPDLKPLVHPLCTSVSLPGCHPHFLLSAWLGPKDSVTPGKEALILHKRFLMCLEAQWLLRAGRASWVVWETTLCPGKLVWRGDGEKEGLDGELI